MAEEALSYAIRFLPRSERDATEAVTWIAESTGSEEAARQWYAGLRTAVGTLATLPKRFAVQERESRLLGSQIRWLLYRRSPGSAAYHVYYTVAEDSPDGPLVAILHVRHASRRPLSRAEAREIRDEP